MITRNDIWLLAEAACKRCLGAEAYLTATNINEIMCYGFSRKIWALDNNRPRDYVTTADIEKLKLLAGPNGYTIWKMMKAKNNE